MAKLGKNLKAPAPKPLTSTGADGRTVLPLTKPVTMTLRNANGDVKGEQIITELVWKSEDEMCGEDFFGMDPTADKMKMMADLTAKLTGQPVKVIGKLKPADFFAAIEVTSRFFPDTPQTPGTLSVS